MIYFTLETQNILVLNSGTWHTDDFSLFSHISTHLYYVMLMFLHACLRGLRCQCGTNFGVISRMTVYDMFPVPNTTTYHCFVFTKKTCLTVTESVLQCMIYNLRLTSTKKRLELGSMMFFGEGPPSFFALAVWPYLVHHGFVARAHSTHIRGRSTDSFTSPYFLSEIMVDEVKGQWYL